MQRHIVAQTQVAIEKKLTLGKKNGNHIPSLQKSPYLIKYHFWRWLGPHASWMYPLGLTTCDYLDVDYFITHMC